MLRCHEQNREEQEGPNREDRCRDDRNRNRAPQRHGSS